MEFRKETTFQKKHPAALMAYTYKTYKYTRNIDKKRTNVKKKIKKLKKSQKRLFQNFSFWNSLKK